MKSWSYEDETALLKAVAKYKPIGEHKVAHLNSIVKTINAVLAVSVTKKDVTEKLETLYDLKGLEDLESGSEPATENGVDDGLDKSDVDDAEEEEEEEDGEAEEDEKQEAKRTVLTRSSTRRKSPEADSSEPETHAEETPRTRMATRNRSVASIPADDLAVTKNSEEGRKTPAEEVEQQAQSNEEAVSDSEEASEADETSKKRTRHGPAQTPVVKALKNAATATPSSRRSTRFSGPVVEATPSKPATRNSTKKSGSTKAVPGATAATPGHSSTVMNTPSATTNGRRRSMRKK